MIEEEIKMKKLLTIALIAVLTLTTMTVFAEEENNMMN